MDADITTLVNYVNSFFYNAPKPEIPFTPASKTTAMEGDNSPLSSMCLVRAAELFPKIPMQKDDDTLKIPFTELSGESVKYLGRTLDSIFALSNYRIFLLKNCNLAETSVPLGLIESATIRDLFTIIISCKDCSTVKCSFATAELATEWFRRISLSVGIPNNLEALFSFPFYAWASDTTMRIHNDTIVGCLSNGSSSGGGGGVSGIEYTTAGERLQRATNTDDLFMKEVKRLEFDLNGPWRISYANKDFKLCPSYPRLMVVPSCITDDILANIATFRSSKRLPSVVWRHKINSAVIARCSQPEVGWFSWRNANDEQLLKALADACSFDRGQHRRRNNFSMSSDSSTTPSSPEGSHEEVNMDESKKITIVDARSYASAVTNRARGGGVECENYYPFADIKFMNLGNIHAIRKSFQALRHLCAGPPDMVNWLGALERTLWLQNISGLLSATVSVCTSIEVSARPVLVHCSDGWDRTPQIVATAQICLDPYYRTVDGFRTLVEREWLNFGHKFADRCGHGPGSDDPNERCPVFLQWLDCIYQIHKQFPCSFEFSMGYLIKLAQHSHSCLFGTFLCNTDKERIENTVFERTFSVWPFLSGPMYKNPLYIANKERVIWPTYNIRDLSLWKEVYLGSLGNQNVSDYPPSTNNLTNQEPKTCTLIKTRSHGDLMAIHGQHGGLTRRSSDPNMAVELHNYSSSTIPPSSSSGAIESYSDCGFTLGSSSKDQTVEQSIANYCSNNSKELNNLTKELIENATEELRHCDLDDKGGGYGGGGGGGSSGGSGSDGRSTATDDSNNGCAENIEINNDIKIGDNYFSGDIHNLFSDGKIDDPKLNISNDNGNNINNNNNNKDKIGLNVNDSVVKNPSSQYDGDDDDDDDSSQKCDSKNIISNQFPVVVNDNTDSSQNKYTEHQQQQQQQQPNVENTDNKNQRELTTLNISSSNKDNQHIYNLTNPIVNYQKIDYDNILSNPFVDDRSNAAFGINTTTIDNYNRNININGNIAATDAMLESVDLTEPSPPQNNSPIEHSSSSSLETNLWYGNIETSTDTLVPIEQHNLMRNNADVCDSIYNITSDSSDTDSNIMESERHQININKMNTNTNQNNDFNDRRPQSKVPLAKVHDTKQSSSSLILSTSPQYNNPDHGVIDLEEYLHTQSSSSSSGSNSSTTNKQQLNNHVNNVSNIINSTILHGGRRRRSNSKMDINVPQYKTQQSHFTNESLSPISGTSRFSTIPSAIVPRSLPLTPPGIVDRPAPPPPPPTTTTSTTIITCPDGLAHALSEKNLRLQQIVYEHRVREEQLHRELHNTRLELIQKTNCNCQHTAIDDPNSIIDNVENVSMCSWEAVDERSAPSSGASSTQPSNVLWVPDHAVSRCTGCSTEFWLGKRKHHCRSCGQIFCADCSEYRAALPEEKLHTPVRLCSPCYNTINVKIQTSALTFKKVQQHNRSNYTIMPTNQHHQQQQQQQQQHQPVTHQQHSQQYHNNNNNNNIHHHHLHHHELQQHHYQPLLHSNNHNNLINHHHQNNNNCNNTSSSSSSSTIEHCKQAAAATIGSHTNNERETQFKIPSN